MRRWILALGVGGLTGCAAEPDGTPGDPLEELVEEQADLSTLDSDDDGWSDQDELDANTDPDDAGDFPYIGGYDIDACRWDLQETGNQLGEVAENFQREDQHGQGVRLHDFCDHTVLLVTSAMWCGPCNDEASAVARWYESLREEGLMVITLLGEDLSGNTPDQAELQQWANAHGIEHAVVADRSWGLTTRFVDGSSLSLPTMHVIGPGGEVLARDRHLSRAQLREMLP